MQLSPMHKILNTRVVGEANLWRKAPSISKLVGPVLWNLRPLQSGHPQWCPQQQTHHQLVPPTISTVRELDVAVANSDVLIWCAASSASEALLAASISRRSFILAHVLSSARPLRLLALSRGGGGGICEVAKRAATTVSSAGSTEGGLRLRHPSL